MYAIGGVYVDHDFVALKPMDALLGSCQFIIGNEHPRGYAPSGGLLASVPKAPFLVHIVKALQIDKDGPKGKYTIMATGPNFTGKILKVR